MRSPRWPVLALLLYVALLPFHSLLIALLLAHTDLPLPLLKLLAAWKEVLLLVTFLGVLAATVVRKELPPLVWVDWIALAWAAQVLLYFVSQLFYAIFALSVLTFVCVGGFAVYHKLVTGLAIPGWTSTIMTACFFGALNALGIGILGEYISRIYDQVRGRPVFVIARRVNFAQDAVDRPKGAE